MAGEKEEKKDEKPFVAMLKSARSWTDGVRRFKLGKKYHMPESEARDLESTGYFSVFEDKTPKPEKKPAKKPGKGK